MGTGQLDRQKIKHHELRRIRLCRGNSDFRASPGIDNLIRFTCNRGANDIRHSQRLCAKALGFFERCKRIACFTGLAHYNSKCAVIDDWLAVTELRSNINFYRYAYELFNVILADETSMVSRTAGYDINFVKGFYGL